METFIPLPDLLDSKQAARKLHLSPAFVVKLARLGLIEAIDVGLGKDRREWRFSQDAIERFINSRKNPMRRQP